MTTCEKNNNNTNMAIKRGMSVEGPEKKRVRGSVETGWDHTMG